MSSTPHDAFFKYVFGRPENARGEFLAQLPTELADQIDWDALTLDNETLGATNLTTRACDLLFRAPFVDSEAGQDAFVFLLHDHQSTPDHRLPLRLFFYVARILERWEGEAKRKPTDPVPPIVCLVIFQGPGEWTGPVELADLYSLQPKVKEALRPYLPGLRLLVDDLGLRSDDEIRARKASPLGKLGWLLLKHARLGDLSEELLRSWSDLFAELEALGSDQDLEATGSYTAMVGDMEPDYLAQVLGELAGERAKEAVMTTAERARAEGRVEGEQRMFLLMLESRFGEVPAEVKSKVAQATEDELKAWTPRVFQAKTIEEVFSSES